MHKLEELVIWQKAMVLVEEVYVILAEFPEIDKFCLISQIRRCVISIPSNIAEGSSRGSTKDFIRFLNMASGSLSEIETQLVIAERLGYITFTPDLQNIIMAIRKMLYRLKQSLSKKLSQ